jgi:hypothetical protein
MKEKPRSGGRLGDMIALALGLALIVYLRRYFGV